MGNAKLNVPVVGSPVRTPPPPIPPIPPIPPFVPPPDELHPVLVKIAIFMVLCFSHIVVIFGFLVPSVGEDPNLDSNTTRHGRGVNQAQVSTPELLPPVLLEHTTRPMPNECWHRLILFVCSPIAIVGLSILVGSATAPPVGGVDPTHVVDVINEAIDYVSGNVASASLTGFLLLQAALKLLEFASEVVL
ncbi:hypothetical protein RSOLAG1IB_12314 [Rhizoctonia solani AG-1 IB]|uniref:Transmembrane protein n=1 Tax=Thanatephorus cucumeris (strain AG1-IB / isolate 7/3/14) TaxID=1108050 RepID=M5CC43_THACB|nr:hypothetical protein BN14_10787 [Rhizoctonia solani AG-1 IB]CEL60169.1 hypothetical protein RSOLAG1IB_12314 [Rhizoctonia solani AG-1 IB]